MLTELGLYKLWGEDPERAQRFARVVHGAGRARAPAELRATASTGCRLGRHRGRRRTTSAPIDPLFLGDLLAAHALLHGEDRAARDPGCRRGAALARRRSPSGVGRATATRSAWHAGPSRRGMRSASSWRARARRFGYPGAGPCGGGDDRDPGGRPARALRASTRSSGRSATAGRARSSGASRSTSAGAAAERSRATRRAHGSSTRRFSGCGGRRREAVVDRLSRSSSPTARSARARSAAETVRTSMAPPWPDEEWASRRRSARSIPGAS